MMKGLMATFFENKGELDRSMTDFRLLVPKPLSANMIRPNKAEAVAEFQQMKRFRKN